MQVGHFRPEVGHEGALEDQYVKHMLRVTIATLGFLLRNVCRFPVMAKGSVLNINKRAVLTHAVSLYTQNVRSIYGNPVHTNGSGYTIKI